MKVSFSKPNKYRAVRTVIDGMTFASRLEAKRYQELRTLEKFRMITDLQVKPRYPLVVEGVKICVYEADFAYYDRGNDKKVVEDCKSVATKTPVYRLKKKLMKVLHEIEIMEITQ